MRRYSASDIADRTVLSRDGVLLRKLCLGHIVYFVFGVKTLKKSKKDEINK